MPTAASMEAAFKVHTDEMARCLATGCHWALFHLVMVIPDICGALIAPNGEAKGERYRDWCRAYLPSTPVSPEERYKIRCLLLHQGRSEGALLDGTPVVYGVAAPGQWPHGGKDGQHTILDVGVLHAELVAGLATWYAALETGRDPAQSHVDRNLSSLVMVKSAQVQATHAFTQTFVLPATVNVTK